MLDIDRYLTRIGYSGPALAGDSASLAGLQLAHMTSVAFENLDVVAGTRVRTTTDWSLPKVVDRRRGGWCYELNGAFSALLQGLGFTVTHHSARVWDPAAHELGPPLDHLCLVVEADGERWLVDAGFGDSAVTPVALDVRAEQHRLPRRARIEHRPDGWAYHEWMHWDDWEVQYLIDPTRRPLEGFQPRSDALAAGAGSGYFSEKPFATRALNDEGDRVWLLRDRLNIRRGDGHHAPTSTPVAPECWAEVLTEWFAMTAPVAVIDRVSTLAAEISD